LPTITDEEFGTVTIRRSAKASNIRIRVAPDGKLRASLPLYAPLFLVKRLIKNSRLQLRGLLSEHHGDTTYTSGMSIGKSHTLIIRYRPDGKSSTTRHGQQIVATLSSEAELHNPASIRIIRDAIIEALRIEAKSHLPKRLAYLATKHGFLYDKVRFSHAGSRWGSCSSNGTISLNIALMKLPFELIDYVLIHELSHTIEMNHSENFWKLVAVGDPHYKMHRHQLKLENPSI
jgi:predicted metal-dependent hydrolase